jgi:hypothetical protein
MLSCSSATVARKSFSEVPVPDMDAPFDPKKTTSYKLMLAVVIILGVLIVIALGFLVMGLVAKGSPHSAPPDSTAAAAFALPPGARIVQTETQPNRLILHVHTPGGDEIDIIDTSDGHLISRIKAAK